MVGFPATDEGAMAAVAGISEALPSAPVPSAALRLLIAADRRTWRERVIDVCDVPELSFV